MSTYTFILKSGGSIILYNCFIVGNGVAGELADGLPRWIADEDIEYSHKH